MEICNGQWVMNNNNSWMMRLYDIMIYRYDWCRYYNAINVIGTLQLIF